MSISPSELDETRGLGFLITEVARLFRQDFDARAQSIKLTRSQWLALTHIRRQEGLSQRELAEQMEIRPITLTRILDRLAAKGWVVRKPHPTDRRVRLLFLTRKAKPYTDSLQAIARETRKKAFAGATAIDLQRVKKLLELVKLNLARDGE